MLMYHKTIYYSYLVWEDQKQHQYCISHKVSGYIVQLCNTTLWSTRVLYSPVTSKQCFKRLIVLDGRVIILIRSDGLSTPYMLLGDINASLLPQKLYYKAFDSWAGNKQQWLDRRVFLGQRTQQICPRQSSISLAQLDCWALSA